MRALAAVRASKARVCRALGLNRSTLDYAASARADEPLRARLREICERHRRFGRPRAHALLKREGLVINAKKTERIYNELGLQLKRRKRLKKKSNVLRLPLAKAKRPNEVWSMDFVFDRLEGGRTIKIFNVVDDYSKAVIGQIVDSSIRGADLVRFFESLPTLPHWLRCDNGPEFWSCALQTWAEGKVKFDFIDPGKPTQNAYVESFNGKMRDECLNEHQFFTISQARALIEEWRTIYHEERPHSSLGMLTPKAFAQTQGNKL